MPQLTDLSALVCDMDGVLWRNTTPLPGFHQFFAFLRRRKIPFILATNNSGKTTDQYVDKLAGLGVTIAPHEIISSADATVDYLSATYPVGSKIYVIGGDGIHQGIAKAGFVISQTEAVAVVVGLDKTLSYQKLTTATLLINAGADFIGTNGDRSYPLEGGQFAPGAGSLLAALEAATNKQATIIGKPYAAMFHSAVKRMQTDLTTTAMIGDRLETDIAGAVNAGLKSILVLSGVTNQKMLANSAVNADWIFEGIDDLVKTWEKLL